MFYFQKLSVHTHTPIVHTDFSSICIQTYMYHLVSTNNLVLTNNKRNKEQFKILQNIIIVGSN